MRCAVTPPTARSSPSSMSTAGRTTPRGAPGRQAQRRREIPCAALSSGTAAATPPTSARGPGCAIERKLVPVVGVYMAWRGKTLMGPSWFNFLSFWGRRNSGEPGRRGRRLRVEPDQRHRQGQRAGGGTTPVARAARRPLVRRARARACDRDAERPAPPARSTGRSAVGADRRSGAVRQLGERRAADGGASEKLRANPIEVRHPDYKPAPVEAGRRKHATMPAVSPDCRRHLAGRLRDEIRAADRQHDQSGQERADPAGAVSPAFVDRNYRSAAHI